MVADIEELEKMDASQIYAKRLNAKEVSTPQNGEHFFNIPDRRWNSQIIRRRSGSENIHFNPGSPQTEEKKKAIFKENQTDLLQSHFKTHRGMMVKLGMISGPSQGTTFTVITLNRESNCTCREQNHSQFHYDAST